MSSRKQTHSFYGSLAHIYKVCNETSTTVEVNNMIPHIGSIRGDLINTTYIQFIFSAMNNWWKSGDNHIEKISITSDKPGDIHLSSNICFYAKFKTEDGESEVTSDPFTTAQDLEGIMEQNCDIFYKSLFKFVLTSNQKLIGKCHGLTPAAESFGDINYGIDLLYNRLRNYKVDFNFSNPTQSLFAPIHSLQSALYWHSANISEFEIRSLILFTLDWMDDCMFNSDEERKEITDNWGYIPISDKVKALSNHMIVSKEENEEYDENATIKISCERIEDYRRMLLEEFSISYKLTNSSNNLSKLIHKISSDIASIIMPYNINKEEFYHKFEFFHRLFFNYMRNTY